MKNKAMRFTALILIFSFVFALSACKKGEPETTTAETTASEETTAEETTAEETTGEATTTPVEETTEESTAAPEETTAPAGINAPVGGSIADIVKFYNQYANATKEYQGKITVQRKMGTKTEITKFLPGLKGILQGVLDRQLKDKDETKTFVNGKNPGDSNDTLEKFLPRSAGQKMSTLKPEGVKTATCVADGNGWKVVITLKKEVMNGIDTIPPHHSSVMDPLEIDNESMDPFTLGDGQVIYGQIEAPNNGGTLSAKVNPNGYLDYLKLDAPLQISGKLGYKGSLNIETVIVGTFWGDLTFTYPS